MIRKFLLVGAICAALASCGQPSAPCLAPAPAPQSPVGDQSMLLGSALVTPVKFGGRSGGSFRSFSSRSYSRPSYSRPSYSKPSYKPTYRSTTNNTTIIQQQSGGGSNGLLWGLGGYMLGKSAAESQSRCQ